MLCINNDKQDFSKVNKPIRTLCVVYGGLHKQQSTQLTKLPVGTEGIIRTCQYKSEYNTKYFLVRLSFNGRFYYAKMAETMLEFI